MSIAMNKRWRELSTDGIAPVAGHLGVYELGDVDCTILYIGRADARSRFGLRGELQRWLGVPSEATQYRTEVTTAYSTRWLELLMEHQARLGCLPPLNPEADGLGLGRLSPS